ncbi:copper resistance CopC family protein [Micromonospora sp. HUAS LYJ1]|uniref:copper resistance CopC family protein n=1 Tax=Micromonospora sp. HUAS LYJ1 TaxID=3061626 RepID=UPI002670DA38|nr:copper resistance CopC family protein [Micromonospora sp. HUAS LYJ1]WKU06109.1 copper resistance protein CopC [Micromonospora sp. HUAS LYJ1]
MTTTSPSRRFAAALLAGVLTLFVAATPARAHNGLRSASPARDATLTRAPTTITLEFLARLDPTFTTIVLTDGTKRRVPTGDPVVSGATGSVRVTGPLPNGTYTVAYRVVSADGHPVQGSYPFTVADPAGPAAPSPDPPTTSSAPTAAPAPGRGGGRATVAGAAGGAVVVLLAAAAVLRRRRRSPRP